MIASKTLYSHLHQYDLSPEQLKLLQSTLLSMMIDFKKLCDENHIDYMLSGGTCLGAVRHKGFIPWDDDADLMMLREEYYKFKKVYDNDNFFKSKYLLVEPLSDPKYVCKMPKIYLRNSVYTELTKAGIDKFNMVYVDLFIIENVPKNRFIRKLKGKIYDFAYLASSLCADYKFPSPPIENACKGNADIRKYYSFRKRLGWMFSHIGGMKFYLNIDEKIANQKKNTDVVAVPSGIRYEREIFDKSIFTNLMETDFCNIKFKIPKDYDKYLHNLYGDYMQIPPKEKREVHGAYCLNIRSTKKM